MTNICTSPCRLFYRMPRYNKLRAHQLRAGFNVASGPCSTQQYRIVLMMTNLVSEVNSFLNSSCGENDVYSCLVLCAIYFQAPFQRVFEQKQVRNFAGGLVNSIVILGLPVCATVLSKPVLSLFQTSNSELVHQLIPSIVNTGNRVALEDNYSHPGVGQINHWILTVLSFQLL